MNKIAGTDQMRVAGAPDLISSYNRTEMSPFEKKETHSLGVLYRRQAECAKTARIQMSLPTAKSTGGGAPTNLYGELETAARKLPVLNNTLNFSADTREMVNKMWVCICRKIQKVRP